MSTGRNFKNFKNCKRSISPPRPAACGSLCPTRTSPWSTPTTSLNRSLRWARRAITGGMTCTTVAGRRAVTQQTRLCGIHRHTVGDVEAGERQRDLRTVCEFAVLSVLRVLVLLAGDDNGGGDDG